MASTKVTSEGSVVSQGSHPGFTTCQLCDLVRVTLTLQMIVALSSTKDSSS